MSDSFDTAVDNLARSVERGRHANRDPVVTLGQGVILLNGVASLRARLAEAERAHVLAVHERDQMTGHAETLRRCGVAFQAERDAALARVEEAERT